MYSQKIHLDVVIRQGALFSAKKGECPVDMTNISWDPLSWVSMQSFNSEKQNRQKWACDL